MNKKKRIFFVLFLIGLILIFIIAGIAYREYTPIIPKNISSVPKKVLVSFEIDDITFAKSQKMELQNALILARKYNITFDLGVIAQDFNDYADPETFKIYQDNQDVFEVIAHGLTHGLDPNVYAFSYGAYGEFSIISDLKEAVPTEIQEQHIKKMEWIFQEKNLTMATKIFVVPYHAGDQNTILLSEKYGYKLIIQKLTTPKNYSEQNYGNITATQDYIDIPLKELLSTNDALNYSLELNRAINLKQNKLDVSFHPANFNVLLTTDYFFKELLNQTSPESKFGFISDRFQN
jgi:Uncharacterized protein conserved in bacteria (DUF2334)